MNIKHRIFESIWVDFTNMSGNNWNGSTDYYINHPFGKIPTKVMGYFYKVGVGNENLVTVMNDRFTYYYSPLSDNQNRGFVWTGTPTQAVVSVFSAQFTIGGTSKLKFLIETD